MCATSRYLFFYFLCFLFSFVGLFVNILAFGSDNLNESYYHENKCVIYVGWKQLHFRKCGRYTDKYIWGSKCYIYGRIWFGFSTVGVTINGVIFLLLYFSYWNELKNNRFIHGIFVKRHLFWFITSLCYLAGTIPWLAATPNCLKGLKWGFDGPNIKAKPSVSVYITLISGIIIFLLALDKCIKCKNKQQKNNEIALPSDLEGNNNGNMIYEKLSY